MLFRRCWHQNIFPPSMINYPRTMNPARPNSRNECVWNSATRLAIWGTTRCSRSRLLMFPVETSNNFAGRRRQQMRVDEVRILGDHNP